MTVCETVRAFLSANMDKAFTARQVSEATGLDFKKASWSLTTFYSRKIVLRERIDGKSFYRMNPEWKPRMRLEGTAAEKGRLYRERYHAKRAAQGLPKYRSPYELRKAEESRARGDARRAEQAAKRERREAEKAERKERLTLERKSKLVAVVAKNAAARKPKLVKVSPTSARPESVEEWMARTGKQPERLPIGAVAERMRA